jgi:bilirubin oxidase
MVAHPFHIHDVQFFLIDRSGNLPGAEESGRKDVVLVPPGDSVLFITKFEDFADTLIPFMYHCHILMHEDDGMMGQFVITPLSVGIKDIENKNDVLSIYPNPSNGIVNIDFKEIEINSLTIYNSIGETIYNESKTGINQIQINTSKWSKGIYTIQVNSKIQLINKKLIIN